MTGELWKNEKVIKFKAQATFCERLKLFIYHMFPFKLNENYCKIAEENWEKEQLTYC